MANKHMKRCSALYVIREMQTETMRYNSTPIRMAKIRTLTTSNAGKDMEQQKPSFIAYRNAKWYSHLGRQFGFFLQN